MTPKEWGVIATDFGNAVGNSARYRATVEAKYASELAYLDRCKNDIATRGHAADEVLSDRDKIVLSVLCRSFSVAHQKYGDLVGRINVVCRIQASLSSFLESYYNFLERPIGLYEARFVSSNERMTWDKMPAATTLRERLSVVSNCDDIFLDKPSYVGFIGALSKFNQHTNGLVLLSKEGLDNLVPPIDGATTPLAPVVLDVDSIIREAIHDRQSTRP